MRIEEIFTQFAEGVLPDLKKVAGSHFGKTIDYVATNEQLVIDGDKHIGVMVYGRGKTVNKTPHSPTLQQALLEWIKRKGITPRPNDKGKIPTQEQLSWSMSRVIHAHGTLLHRSGRPNFIFDNIITKSRVDSLFTLIGDEYFTEIQTRLIKWHE